MTKNSTSIITGKEITFKVSYYDKDFRNVIYTSNINMYGMLNEDRFVEMTPDNKTEHTYSAIERVSIVDDKVIYIHINNVMSYMLPFSCFESKGQYDDFFRFLKTKCANIDVY